MNKDFCEREREREFFKSPALSYIYIYTTRPKRKKKQWTNPRLQLSRSIHRPLSLFATSRRMRSLFGDPNSFSPAGGAASYLVWCRHNSYSFFSFFLSSKHTHKKDASWRWFLFLLFKQIAVVLLNCWAAGRNESLGPPRLFLADGQKRKKKLSEDRTRFVIGRKRQCRSVFSLISSSFFFATTLLWLGH